MNPKTPIEWIKRYEVRKGHDGWAVIHVDSKGFFAVVSDYGNYAYHWTAFEGSFAHFLARLDPWYLCSKLSPERQYDSKDTLQAVKEHILQYRREGTLSKEQARSEWDLLKEFGDLEHKDGFGAWCQETKIDCAFEFSRSMQDPHCRIFCEKLYPAFVEQLIVDFPKKAA